LNQWKSDFAAAACQIGVRKVDPGAAKLLDSDVAHDGAKAIDVDCIGDWGDQRILTCITVWKVWQRLPTMKMDVSHLGVTSTTHQPIG
jgi:hypothetical protein